MIDPTSKNLLKSFAADGVGGVSDISSLEDKFSSGIFRSPSDQYIIETPCRGLSDPSQVLLVSYNETYRRLFRNRMTVAGSLHTEPREIDFSLLISPDCTNAPNSSPSCFSSESAASSIRCCSPASR